MSKDPEIIDVDHTELANRADLDRDATLMRIDNETIQAIAQTRPWTHAGVLADIKEQLETYPTFAAAAIYNKPVGRDKDTGQMKYARGLSIRAAEAIAAACGTNRVHVRQIPVDADTVRVEATYVDYRNGRIWQAERIVSKNYTDRYKKRRRHSDDRFYDLVLEAAGSKAVREVILRCTPPGLRSELERIAEEQINQLLDETTASKIVSQFAGRSVTKEMLEQHVGKRLDGFTKSDRATLLGVWNALEAEETTIAEAFPAAVPEVGETAGPGGLAETVAARKAAQAASAAPPPAVTPAATDRPVAPPAAAPTLPQSTAGESQRDLLDVSGPGTTDPQKG